MPGRKKNIIWKEFTEIIYKSKKGCKKIYYYLI